MPKLFTHFIESNSPEFRHGVSIGCIWEYAETKKLAILKAQEKLRELIDFLKSEYDNA